MIDATSPKGYKGYCIDLIDEIAKIVKFDYEIKEVEDGKFGNMDENVSKFKQNFEKLEYY
jgi:glutamate receptor, ionotropic, invertebrate